MAVALFDLDNTLLSGDSDYLWGTYLVEQGVVDGDYYETENNRYYREYKEGVLDIFEFLRFSLRPLRDNDPARMLQLRKSFIRHCIEPIIPDASRKLIEKHRDLGDELVIITATNSFVTSPIAELLGVHHLIATDPEVIEGQYTGNVAGEPCFREGKVKRLRRWLDDFQMTLDASWFYSDSHNDLPLLEVVDNPVVVDPDEILAELARQRGWPAISLHG
ncbi:MAG: HAD family hydrolase [Gammaproteobacteria bacterium]|nr:HAD family hydrolase [Gammaproteobacteria bacterium]